MNWIRNGSGEWINTRRIDRIYIISFGEGYKIMLLHPDQSSQHFDDHLYETRGLAQMKIDDLMKQAVWE